MVLQFPQPSMSQSSSRSRKRTSRTAASEEASVVPRIRPTEPGYTMALIDTGIYPPERKGQKECHPSNMAEIQQHIQKRRSSLSATFDEDAFVEFKIELYQPSNEATLMHCLDTLSGKQPEAMGHNVRCRVQCITSVARQDRVCQARHVRW